MNLIGIIDYGAGNIRSVSNSLARLGVPHVVSNKPEELQRVDKLILPGVGEARSAMNSLYDVGLLSWLRTMEKPFLGICLGMQLLFDRSTERATDCLGIIGGTIVKFDDATVKVPHMGWNTVELDLAQPLFAGMRAKEFFYFVHSYAAPVTAETIGSCAYGITFSAAVRTQRVYGVQFHPEKSGPTGLQVLRNFVERC